MNKKSTPSSQGLKSKIKTYSALAVSAIALDASAQVGYTDIPDTTLINNGDFLDIDLNSDGINDIRLTFSANFSSGTYAGTSYSFFYRYDTREIVADPINGELAVDSSFFPIAFSSNQPISQGTASNPNYFANNSRELATFSSYFFSTSGYSYSGTYTYGNFNGAVDKYLGVRFNVGANQHYGWIRLDVANQALSVTIKDFAFDSTANASILAGDRGALVGLERTSFEKTDFFSSHRQLNFKGLIPANTQLTIVDLKGQKVQEVILSENQRSQALTNLSNGIYIVEIRDGKSALRKKMWLEAN